MAVETPERELAATWDDFTYDVIPIDELYIDKYQRELTSLADEIARDFRPHMVGTLIVSERKGKGKGKYSVIDGQTRFRGAEKSGKVNVLPCVVYRNMTIEHEAELFAELQRKRRNIATYQRFRSALVAKDPMAQSIAKILKEFGLEVGPKKDQQLQAVAALEAAWKKDPELLRRTIHVLHEAWSGDQDAKDIYSAEMIRGVARFLGSSDGVEDERLINRLRNTNPGKLRLRAGMLREGKGGGGHTSVYMADALLTEYTKRG